MAFFVLNLGVLMSCSAFVGAEVCARNAKSRLMRFGFRVLAGVALVEACGLLLLVVS